MVHTPPSDAAGFRRYGAFALGGLLAITVVGGGSSHGTGSGVALAQLVALPVLGWAVAALYARRAEVRRLPLAPLLLAAGIVLLLVLQQAPVPASLWNIPSARAALERDLASVGVDISRHWSLSPSGSERALWSLLPGLALFAGALAVDRSSLRPLLLLVVALGAASLLVGATQMVLPRDSILNPYPRWAPSFNGIFENPNHQASLLALSATIVSALPWRTRSGAGFRRSAAAWVLLGAMVALAVPLTGSRAGIGLGVLGVGLAGLFRWRSTPAPGRARTLRPALVIATAVALAVGALAAWSQFRLDETVRWSLARATAAMARDQAPLGAGFGMFTAWFDQSAPATLVQWEYFPHAHNEYVQWWFELGWAGAACVLAVLAVLVALRPRPASSRAGADCIGFGVPLAAWLSCWLLLLHSLVDYPLRTPALMGIAGLLAGVLVASSSRPTPAHPPSHRAGQGNLQESK